MQRPIDRLFGAVTFAEAGEPQAALDLLDGRRVVLALGDAPPAASTLRYVLNCCPRVQAGLDILHPSSLRPWRLRGLLQALSGGGVSWRQLPFDGDVQQAVTARLQGDAPVIFVILDRALNPRPETAPWNALGCPVVVP
ncbi:MAG: hypothetical protein PHQ14_00785 [Chromatiales bacterium]|nr:hypothetical protein [Chromatiales bacterium]MDX9767010.1 hypothetical protein [Ectothiorhodospiraceae bacterium]